MRPLSHVVLSPNRGFSVRGSQMNQQNNEKPLCVAVAGLGLIGGSIALGLKSHYSPTPTVIALDRDERSLATALEQGSIDFALSEPGDALRQADVVFLATPVLTIPALAKSIAPFLKPGAVVTDVGSTKGWLSQQMLAILPSHVHYVAGHPMAGREKSGFSAANPDLFQDKWYILTPDSSTDQIALSLVKMLAESLGAFVDVMNRSAHDQCAAVISHTPHVAAAALVNLLDCYPDPDTSLKLAGGGFRDTTRIASSDADMWADVCISNASAILHSLESYQGIIRDLADAIEQGDRATIHAFFRSAKLRRDCLLERLEQNKP